MEKSNFSENAVDDKKEITRRFVIAVEYLSDSGRIKKYRDLEVYGIKAQRISDFKKYVKDDTKNSYVSAVEIKILHEEFGASFEYILCGQKPIYPDSEEKTETREPNSAEDPGYNYSRKNNDVMHEIPILKSKVQLLQLEIDNIKRKIGV